ncbi:hypothetical protein V5799_024785 [Amblyomma americanum]|uniref:Uncharacterized protein n=1 Tax=Amblyomma americanum TaxID=6943 RepID=A0AAQ4EBK4_AMBAM
MAERLTIETSARVGSKHSALAQPPGTPFPRTRRCHAWRSAGARVRGEALFTIIPLRECPCGFSGTRGVAEL